MKQSIPCGEEWGKKDVPEGWNVYALLWPSNDKWTVALCSQKSSGGPLYKFGKSKSTEEIDFPKRTCALIPISEIMERVSSKLSELLGELKNHGGERETIVNLPSCYVIAMAQGAPSLSYISERVMTLAAREF